ncbi:MAG: tRNA (adenosine(37)-N6)-threonylcarbamoyltransferase complex dimerization subunit type 1 TsaB [Candidatus Promineifilaceae bacterium]
MILAIDTASKWTGLALHDGRQVLAEHGWRSASNQTVELAPAVAALLGRAGAAAADLSAIAVAIGPGSYTGLRIGLGFAKGLALANQTKLIGVPTLDIVAAALPPADGALVALCEAGRSRFCAGVYHWQGSKGWQANGQAAIADLAQLVAGAPEGATLAGEIGPAVARAVRNSGKKLKLASPARNVRRPAHLAEIGWLRLRRGWTDDPDNLAPIYLRDPAGA